MAALVGGIGALVLGIKLIIVWRGEFIDLLMGGIPIMLVLGGALAGYLGFEEIKDKKTAENFSDSPGNLKTEDESLKEEIKELKEEKEEEKSENGS